MKLPTLQLYVYWVVRSPLSNLSDLALGSCVSEKTSSNNLVKKAKPSNYRCPVSLRLVSG